MWDVPLQEPLRTNWILAVYSSVTPSNYTSSINIEALYNPKENIYTYPGQIGFFAPLPPS